MIGISKVFILFVLLYGTKVTVGQSCSYMWDTVFESNTLTPPTMCSVNTVAGSPCIFPFRYSGVTYRTCTVRGPTNTDLRPQCAISVDANGTATSWSFCTVPNDAIIWSATVRKNGPWTQNSGSTQGGTMLWIYGRRFAPVGFSSTPSTENTNVVKLVGDYSVYDCEMHNDKCTETQLTCYTPAMPAGAYQIRVYVRGQLIPIYQYYDKTRAVFIASNSQTPTITSISPQSGNPQSMIQLTGSFKTACYSRDVDGCAQDNNALISRVFVGGHLCNLIDPTTGATYPNANETRLECKFEGDEVGSFNISMLVTNEYGRALISPSLYRVSANEELYTFQSYAVINQVSPNSGSTAGGTTLTITGNFFSQSANYPLTVKVGGSICSIISVNLTTILCQTSPIPSTILSRYQGGRGLQMYRVSNSYNQAILSSANPPAPTNNATMTWVNEAKLVSDATGSETAWFIGFLNVPKTGNYTFTITTNGYAALFLSSNDDPANKVLLTNSSNTPSVRMALQNNTNYYMFCVGSRSSGSLLLSVQARLHETNLVGGVSSWVKNEIQRITISTIVIPEEQNIALSMNVINGTEEVQMIQVDPSMFQIGFRGVYTAVLNGQPAASVVQAALNDLPSIYPLQVTVNATIGGYYIRFPIEMGDVPLFTCISSSRNQPNVTELVSGVESGSSVAFEIDGQLTDYVDFVNTNVTQSTLKTVFNNLFTIRCPPSVNNARVTSSIKYVQDFESNCVYDGTKITKTAFCGQCSSSDNDLLVLNSAAGNFLCFAYQTSDIYLASIGLTIQYGVGLVSTITTSIPFSSMSDSAWHYVCSDVRSILIAQGDIPSSTTSITIQNAWLNNRVANALLVDSISVRTSYPVGYEDRTTVTLDQSANNSCVFPFNYNNNVYTACTLNNNQVPICADSQNNTYDCTSSSIEGVRRMYPLHQLLYNSLRVNYTTGSANIDVAFRYSDCASPSLIVAQPSNSSTITRVSAASSGASGTYDLLFNGQTYASIPVDILPSDLSNRLQGSNDFGFLNVKRTRDCTGYDYTIEWLARGGAKDLMSTTNSGSITPAGTTVLVSTVQSGGAIFNPISGDMTKTYNTNPQIEVFVGGSPSQCVGSGTCDFQWLSSQTPTVTSVVQSGTTLLIVGTGFSSIPSLNNVIIGGVGSCAVVSSTTTSINCTIASAPAGTYPIQVNIDGQGLANGTSGFTATVVLRATSISPTQGGAGGGYILTIVGAGFSTSSVVTIGNNLCTDIKITNFTLLECRVPASSVLSNTNVSVVISSGSNTVQVSTPFMYDVANTPYVTSFSPSSVTTAGGILNVTGTNFGMILPSISIGTTQITVRSVSTTQILAVLPSLAPGIYPIRINTDNGYARPELSIEYRFYVQNISPKVGSLYGGTDVYIQGYGFDETTTVSFTDGSSEYSCSVVSHQNDQVRCRTSAAAPSVIITSNGVDPTYGSGFAWSPQYSTVQQGAVVQWRWGTSSALLPNLVYRVQQVANSQSTVPYSGGFDSGNGTASGTFSYQFQNIGTYYYWSPSVDQGGSINMRGVINVVSAQSQILTVNVKSRSILAQSCVFPFTFNLNNYSSCTTVNDTRLWCSPTSMYQGQRIYCSPTATVPNSTCLSSSLINPSSCSQTIPTGDLQFLFTPCTVGTVNTMTPTSGTQGTSITITGTGFSTTQCENKVLIGSYECPIQSVTSTQIVCVIGSNSMLSAATIHEVHIQRDRQGMLSRNGLIQFQFQAKITSISPTTGSTSGGTLVTITGDGFLSSQTRLILGGIEYTSTANITYNQIQFYTTSPPTAYINQLIPVTILIGNNAAICSIGSCTYTWSRSSTPIITSVSPTSISGSQNLIITGQNLNPTGLVSIGDIDATIGGETCSVTSVTNSSIACTINALQLGNQSILVSVDGVGDAISTVQLMSTPSVSNVSPSSSGTFGGTLLTIQGNGFSRNSSLVQVSIGNSPCTIIDSSPSQIRCQVPPSQTQTGSTVSVRVISNSVSFPTSANFTYDASVTPQINSINPTVGTSGHTLTISGSNFVNGQTSVTVGGTSCPVISVSSNSITCTIQSSPAGDQPVIVSVNSFGRSNANILFQYSLQISSVSLVQGSFGGGQSVTVNGDGFNTSGISVTICGVPCQSVSVSSNTQMVCKTPAISGGTSTDRSCNLTVTVGALSASTAYTYRVNLTTTILSISPIRGGTGGGTTLTINGTNFPNLLNGVTVSIAGISCTVQSITANSIICLTGAYPYTTVQAPVIVNIGNYGNSIGSVLFQYIDLWSSPWTWGGGPPPEEGTIVYIDGGKTVYFDTVTPILKAVVIDNASLIFDDNQNVALNAEYILIVNGGRFQVGTESNRFQHQAVITMYGHLRSIELPIFGAKVLALRSGSVDMHGISMSRTWTKLSSTANNGSTQISLINPVNWPIGSLIIIATTGNYLSQGESEKRFITAVSSDGRTLTLNAPLTYTHLGVTRMVNSLPVDVRGEVGLLSHNVIFRGSTDSSWNQTIEACPTGFNPGEFAVQTCFLGRYGQEMGSDQFGATIMASGESSMSDSSQTVILRLSNIEIYNVGQAFRLGRYPVHFHMNGNMNSSYIKSSAIHQSFNRAVNIHATHYVTVENNVIYNIMGGAMFLEDGIEVGNAFRSNLAVFVRTSSSLLNEDVTPAAFWVTSPNNIVEHNAVAGGTHFGYWYRMLRTPDGPSFAMYPNGCPYRQPIGRFFNNSVHSVGRFGVWIFPEYSPTASGSCSGFNPSQAVFDQVVSWKNDRGFEWVMSSTIQVRNALVFDNADTGIRCVTAINHQDLNVAPISNTFYNENTGSSVINSIIIGDTGVSGGSITPSEGGLVVMWDRGLRVRNITFINFPSNRTQAIYGPVIAGRCTTGCGGWLTRFSQLTFASVSIRGRFRWVYDGFYQDDDGSLSGTAGTITLPPDGLSRRYSACSRTPNFDNAITCPASLGSWIRFAFNGASLGQNGDPIEIYDDNNGFTQVPWGKKRLTHPLGYIMNLLARKTYLIKFQNNNASVNLSYSGVMYSLAPGDYLVIQHPISYKPDRVYTTSSRTLAVYSSTPLTSTSDHGNWYYDNNTALFSFIIKNPSTNTASIDVSVPLNVIKCRYPNCEAPAQPGFELPASSRPSTALFWSNDSHWSFASTDTSSVSQKPGNNTDIFIPRGVWLVVDHPLPSIRALRIEGVLEFEQGINNILRADSIFINGGQMIVGWPNNPLTSNVDIIITGSSSANVLLPNDAGSMGPKVIGVFGGLDLHGIAHNVTWTRLANSASAGQNVITLSEPVDWSIGDEIIVTTTDTRIDHTERHTITGITSGRTISLARNLSYSHLVIRHSFPNGQTFNIAAGVGLLTHNVRVICQSPPAEVFGFRILVSDYATNVWNPVGSEYINTYYKGYARISNTQFIGFGQYIDVDNEDKREALHLFNLGAWNASRPTYIDSCSFDSGYYSAIGVWSCDSIPIKNNVVYNTYESAIVVTGKNNIVEKNLVSTIYWSGQARPQYFEFNKNFDGAIMSSAAVSVVMRNNLVVGVQRFAYRIQGNACPGTVVPSNITNDYDNNEAHSTMSGVNIWPNDKGFQYDQNCILMKGFKTYKNWFYGIYINNHRNIIVDSCSISDSYVGILPFVIGPGALTHTAGGNTITIRNSLIIGASINNDCDDVRDKTTLSERMASSAMPGVAEKGSDGEPVGRTGISFPYVSGFNMIPTHPFTSVGAYPMIEGYMAITNVTFAYFNNVCSRKDVVIRVSQHNDDGQHPVGTSSLSIYNTSRSNLIYNGRPNLGVVNPSDCVDMDCDGLKKALLIDTDGTMLGERGSVFSQAEYNWGSQSHGVGDFRIPTVVLANGTGQRININLTYPYRGIIRGPTCGYQPSWQMYYCPNDTDYRMLIIESMDSDTETRRLSPVAVMSNGYIDLINGPQDHGWCNGYTCQKRVSTFMAIVRGRQYHDIYLSSTTPNKMRFRLLNSDSSISSVLSLYYSTLQQVDVYANDIYVSPTNKDLSYTQYLVLTDQPANLTTSSPPGTNYFNRSTQMLNFVIRGDTVIDLKVSELIVLRFGLPATTSSAFFGPNVLTNLAYLLGVSSDKLRRVQIVSASNTTRIRRQASLVYFDVEIREEPAQNLSFTTSSAQSVQNLTAIIINTYQSGEMQQRWENSSFANGTTLQSLAIREPSANTTVQLGVISRVELVRLPSGCRQMSPCDVQPVLVAYDSSNRVITKLGSNELPWQVQATIVGQTNVTLVGAIANYTDGQTQFTGFGVSELGTYSFRFRFISPFGVSSTFIFNTSLSANTSSVSVSTAQLDAVQVASVDVVSVNQTFNLSVAIVDQVSRAQLQSISWSSFNWSATVSLYTLPQHNANGTLITNASSTIIIDRDNNRITATNLAINDIGMYLLQVQILSSNRQYSITCKSTAILVKNSSTTLEANVGTPTTYVTFKGDYYALQSQGVLETTRATIYNYFKKIGLDMNSDLVLSAGSIIASFVPNTASPSQLSAAVTTLTTSGSNAITNLPVSSVTITNRTYTVDSSSSSSSSSNNVGLAVGLTVGLVCGSILIVFMIISFNRYQKKRGLRRLFNDPCHDDAPMDKSKRNSDYKPRESPTNFEAQSETRPVRLPPIIVPPPVADEKRISSPTSGSHITEKDERKRVQSPNPASNIELIQFD